MENNRTLTEKEFSLLSDSISALHGIRNMDDMLEAVITKLRQNLSIQGVSIALHDPARKEFYFIRTVEPGKSRSESREQYLRFPDHEGIAGWVMKHNQSTTVHDVSTDQRFYDGLNSEEEFATRSMICVPLNTRKGFWGVLYALNKERGAFSMREEKILEILSGTVAVSLENARLYGELQDHVHDLERQKLELLAQVQQKYVFNEIIGSSPPMQKMFDLMEKVIDTSTTVLIQGETGTGKELIARVLHYNGPKKNRSFIAENCAALPEDLLESQLFGHVRGAFTGAVANKKGLFEIADGGTLFLDEVGEMSTGMQAKLLRVLQEGRFRPVGSSSVKQVNVRIIASTNRDLEAEVSKGRFREDLYYRINIFQITPPPLRQRKEDILVLASHFLQKYADRDNKPAPVITPSVLDMLIRYEWPGNVRELENEMERALAMAAGGKTLEVEQLSEKIRAMNLAEPLNCAGAEGTLREVVGRVERSMIHQTLLKTGGNRSQAAKVLGLSRQGLLNKIATYTIDL